MVELEEEETLAGKAGAGGAHRRTVSARRCCVYAPPLSVGPVAPRLVAVVSRIPSVTIGFLSVV